MEDIDGPATTNASRFDGVGYRDFGDTILGGPLSFSVWA